jgi:hypothetical protein
MTTFKDFICEVEGFANQITSGEHNGKKFKISVGKAYEFAKTGNYLKTLPVTSLEHDLSWWQGDKTRMMAADTAFPLLVFIVDGNLTVADGLNRLKKAVSIEKKRLIQAYVVPFDDLPANVFVP